MTQAVQLVKLDRHHVPSTKGEVRAFACIKNEIMRLPFLLDYHRKLGVDRFFFIDNGSTDGTVEFLQGERDCHCFHSDGNFFADNVEPPRWTNALRNVFGDGYWSLSLDADEMSSILTARRSRWAGSANTWKAPEPTPSHLS